MKTTGGTDAPSLRYGAVRVLKGRHAGKVGYYDDDEGDRAVVYFAGPLDVLIKLDLLANVTTTPTSPPRSRWTASPNSWVRLSGCQTMRGLTREAARAQSRTESRLAEEQAAVLWTTDARAPPSSRPSGSVRTCSEGWRAHRRWCRFIWGW